MKTYSCRLFLLVILSDRSAAKGVEGPASVFALYQGTTSVVTQMLQNQCGL
jgi:hypothetical protein